MAQLRQDYGNFQQADAEILVLGPENAEVFANYWAEHDLPFVGLPDPEHRVLKLYGQEIKLLRLGRMPAQVLVDKQGVVRFVHYGQSMRDIPSNEELFPLLEESP